MGNQAEVHFIPPKPVSHRCSSAFANFTVKHLCWSLFFDKVIGWKACSFIKKRLRHRFFPVKFAKSLRTPFF